MNTRHTAFQWLRWPLMPIASCFFGLLASVVVFLVLSLFDYLSAKESTGYGGLLTALLSAFLSRSESAGQIDQTLWHRCVESMIVVGVFGYVYSLTAYLVSPRGKEVSTAVMLTVPSLVYFLNAILTWFAPAATRDEAILATVTFMALLIAGVCGINAGNEAHSRMAKNRVMKRRGLSIDDAIPTASNNSLAAVQEEYAYLMREYGKMGKDWILQMQSTLERNGNKYDLMQIKVAKSGENKTIHFNVSSCFRVSSEARRMG